MSRSRFAGMNFVIVGGCADIGRMCASVALKEGANVVVTGRREAERAESVASLSPLGNVSQLPLDLSDITSIGAFPRELQARFQRVDVLLFTSGATRVDADGDTPGQIFDDLMAVNARGPYLLTTALKPLLRSGASVVCVSSAIASRRGRGMVAYAASKAALEAIVRVTALDLVERGVRVNAVAPGPTRTDGLLRPLHADDDPSIRAQRIASSLPNGRLTEVSEVVEVIMFLASSASSAINATTLLADGGWNAA